MPNKYRTFSSLLLIISFLLVIVKNQVSAYASDFNQYFRCGYNSVVTNGNWNSVNGDNYDNYTISIEEIENSDYSVFLGLREIMQNNLDTINQMHINIEEIDKNETSFLVKVQSDYQSNIQLVSISYICVSRFMDNYQIYVVNDQTDINQTGQLSDSSHYVNLTKQLVHPADINYGGMSNQWRIRQVLRGFRLTKNNQNNSFRVRLEVQPINQKEYNLNVSSYESFLSINISELSYSLFVFNQTLANSSQIHVQIQNKQFFYGSSQKNLNQITNPTHNSLFLGLKGFYTHDDTQMTIKILNFQTNLPTVNLNISLNQTAYYQIIDLKVYKCDNSTLNRYLLHQQCYQFCPPEDPSNNNIKLYSNNSLNRCQPCLYDCETCNNSLSCLSCPTSRSLETVIDNQTSNQYIRCLPNQQHFQNYQYEAGRCDQNVCQNCYLSATNCTSCHQAKYLNTTLSQTNQTVNTCQSCSTHCTSCQNKFNCTNCQDLFNLQDYPYNYTNETICVQNCTLPCLQCKKIYVDQPYLQCLLCQYQYQVDPNNKAICRLQCANGQWNQTLEGCDDGNSQNGDGCSVNCQQQRGYQCYSQLDLQPQKCYYQAQFILSQLTITKIPHQNAFTLALMVGTINKKVLSQIDWIQCLHLDLQGEEYRLELVKNQMKDADDPMTEILLKINYLGSFILDKLQINFYPSPQNNTNNITSTDSIQQPISFDKFSKNHPSNLTLAMVSSNGLAIRYYEQSQYTSILILDYLFLFLGVSLLIICLIGTVGGKVVLIDLILLVNSQYCALISLDGFNVLETTHSMTYLNIGIVFSSLIFDSNSQDTLTPTTNWLQLNYNFLQRSLLYLIFLLLPPLTFLISKLSMRFAPNTKIINILHHVKNYALAQYTLYIYFLGSYTFGSCLALDVQDVDIVGIGMGVGVIIGGGGISWVFAKNKYYFWEFRTGYYRYQAADYWLNIQLGVATVGAVCLSILGKLSYQVAIPMGLSLFLIIIVAVIDPFRKQTIFKLSITIQIINILSLACIFALKLLYIQILSMSEETSIDQLNHTKYLKLQKIIFYLPIMVFILLLGAFIYTVYVWIPELKEGYNDIKEFLEEMPEKEGQGFQLDKFKSGMDRTGINREGEQIEKGLIQQYYYDKNMSILDKILTIPKPERDLAWKNYEILDKQILNNARDQKQCFKNQVKNIKKKHHIYRQVCDSKPLRPEYKESLFFRKGKRLQIEIQQENKLQQQTIINNRDQLKNEGKKQDERQRSSSKGEFVDNCLQKQIRILGKENSSDPRYQLVEVEYDSQDSWKGLDRYQIYDMI